MIVFNNVTKDYGNGTGLIDASVHINRGDFVFLVGPSGAGKTTFIKLILKEIEPDKGKIMVAGNDVTHLPRREVPELRQKIGMVFQDFRLLEKKTVYENVAFAMEVLHKSRKEIRERVPYVLNLVDIEDKKDRYPDELSAGEQQRVGIARAIVNQPRVLICDEPTGNLDPVTAMDIMALLEKINVRGTTILMVTHARDIVDKMNKRVVAIDNGRIVRDEEGTYGYKQQGPEEGEYDPTAELNFGPSIRSMTLTTTNIGSRSGKNLVKESLLREAAEYGMNPEDFDRTGDRDTMNLVDTYIGGGEDIYD